MDTLDLVLRASGGVALIPLKKTALILGLEPQTIRNRMSMGHWPMQATYQGRNVFFTAENIAEYIDRCGEHLRIDATPRSPFVQQIRRRGAPTAAERQAARAQGLSVREWRTSAAAQAESTRPQAA